MSEIEQVQFQLQGMRKKARFIFILTVLIVIKGFGQKGYWTEAKRIITTEDLKHVLGDWHGSLTYVDYGTGKPFSMPANLSVEQGKNDREYVLRHSYPNEPKANAKDKIKISNDGRQLNEQHLVSKKVSETGQIELTTEYKGRDDNRHALIQMTYILDDAEFVIRKEVRFDESGDWIMRNEYRYIR